MVLFKRRLVSLTSMIHLCCVQVQSVINEDWSGNTKQRLGNMCASMYRMSQTQPKCSDVPGQSVITLLARVPSPPHNSCDLPKIHSAKYSATLVLAVYALTI